MAKVAIFASGSGSNFENIVLYADKGELNNIEITSLYTDYHDAYCVKRAEQLQREEVEWIILAGYMRLIGPDLLDAYEGKILNIHPSLLPKYKGKDAIGQAFNSGDKVTGSTVHYVDSGMDTGEIIEQRQCDIKQDDTKENLEERVKRLEYELYPSVIAKVIK